MEDRLVYNKHVENLEEISMAYASLVCEYPKLTDHDSVTWKQQFVDWANEFEDIHPNIDGSDDYLILIADFAKQKILEFGGVKESLDEPYTEAVEVCPHCVSENVFPNWDVQKQGYVAKCQHCGEEIMLCDECLHADDNECRRCDWHESSDGTGHCFRGSTVRKCRDVNVKKVRN